MDQKVNQQQNTVCLEHQIYASSENFTLTLLVMLETFRRSAPIHQPPAAGEAVHLSYVSFSDRNLLSGLVWMAAATAAQKVHDLCIEPVSYVDDNDDGDVGDDNDDDGDGQRKNC